MGKLYRIGELSKLSRVSSRTIDYYTKFGLIHPKVRTEKNYRLYDDETVQRLERIELLKKEKYTLEEIKQQLKQWGKIGQDEHIAQKLTALQLHMKELEQEVKEIKPMIEKLKPSQARAASSILTTQSAACIEALLLLLGKGPIM